MYSHRKPISLAEKQAYEEGLRIIGPFEEPEGIVNRYDEVPGESAEEKLHFVLAQLGWTQAQIAEALSVSRRTVRRKKTKFNLSQLRIVALTSYV